MNGITYFGDGVAFANSGAATGGVPGTGAPVEFATFALGSSTPTSFKVGLLSNYPDTTYYQLSLYSSNPNTATPPTPLSSVIIDPGQTDNPHANEFYYADVFGVASGDYLVVNGYTSHNYGAQVTLGGVTFGDVPEPSTYALLGFGGLALLFVSRRAKAA